MWNYYQESGEIKLNWDHVAYGYSGYSAGKNNPAAQQVHDVGPIPTGWWLIEGPPVDTPEHGPYVLRLTPGPGTETFGRSGFLIHGDSLVDPGRASKGCICTGKWVRERIWESNDRDLLVL